MGIGKSIAFRAPQHHFGHAQIVWEFGPNEVLARRGESLWRLSRPSAKAPWKGYLTQVADYYATVETIRKLYQQAPGCAASDPKRLECFQSLVRAGLVPLDVVNPPANESLWVLGKRLHTFGLSYHSALPYDSRERVALLLVQLGIPGARKYLFRDTTRMRHINLREVSDRAKEILEAEVGKG